MAAGMGTLVSSAAFEVRRLVGAAAGERFVAVEAAGVLAGRFGNGAAAA